jgi:hypothetical protein
LFLSQIRGGFTAAAVVALLAGCSGASQLAPSPSGAQPAGQPNSVRGVKQPLGASALSASKFAALRAKHMKVPHVAAVNKARANWGHALFVSDYIGNVVQEFQPNKQGAVIATISDVVGPQGMASDRHGNLYVTSQGTSAVNVYTPGMYTASKVLNEGNSQAPAYVAVCPNGTVYVSNTYANNGYQNGSVQIFAPGATSPTGSIPDSNIFFSFGVACDAANNVWYDYLDTNFSTAVAEYVPTTGTITQFGSLGIQFPGGIRSFGNGQLSINDQSNSQFDGTVDVFDSSNMAAGPTSIITGFADPVSGSWLKSHKATWQADISNAVVEFAKVAKTPAIQYSVGAGVLWGPEDAVIFPAGDR